MSRIDGLVAELAPEGVEHRRLGEVGEFIRGTGLQKADLTDKGMPAVHYGQIHTIYGVWTESTRSFTSPELGSRLRRGRTGDLLIATTSEDDAAVAKATAWLGDQEVVISGDAYIFRHRLDPRYVSYFFQSANFQDQKQRFISGTKVRRISGDALAKIIVPVPPLEVQREIVRILDQFTQLEEELEAELEARQEQYRFYRQSLLDEIQADRAELGSLGKWAGGMTPSKSNRAYWDNGHIPWLASMDISGEGETIRGRVTDLALSENPIEIIPAPSIAVVMRSNILRRRLPVRLLLEATTVNQDVRVLTPRERVDAAYVYECLAADEERLRVNCVRTDGSMAAVDSSKFFSWTIPMPSYGAQLSLSRMLAHFRGLTSDFSSGLPAEILFRWKQYEYYRDKVFTFRGRIGQ